ncbi:methyltransferase domain-containing protein [Nonomuraea phyllanthi]|uniref:Methyltransferase domain-containing protein n=1 Tax=Nonomuraea phyllanthi TaxID=2219224 RepID=A0A5C4WTJ2_9ACTN|nr:methyltransferase domain-containing protein [Nonomuraea phyllanthi]KAB8196074.1 methyltransferase domain-containing protein [Nonomuraea phyllanthi]QFY07533.1 methyltransferase domain-containing protein [Nonomuraea phyllanthi]
MTTTRESSYYGAGEHPHPENELNRLKIQATASWPKEARVMREWGLRPDADVLEIGAGPGFITELLLQEVPQGSVTALELEEHQIAEAKAYLGPHDESRLRFVQGSVMEQPLPDAAFDVAHARFLLQHVPDPLGALRETHRVLRPGGQVVIADVDDALWGSVHPAPRLPVIDQVIQMRIDLQAERGGDRLIGRRIPKLLVAAGFEQIKVEAVAVSSDELGMEMLEPQLNIRSRYAMMVALNPAAEDAVRELADAVDEFLASPLSSAMLLVFMYSGVKP